MLIDILNKIFFSCLITLFLLDPALGTFCDSIACTNITDYVCANTTARDGTQIIMRYQNVCLMRRKQCQLRNYVVIQEIPHRFCGIDKRFVATTPMPGAVNVQRVAALKSLKLINHDPFTEESKRGQGNQLWDIVERVFKRDFVTRSPTSTNNGLNIPSPPINKIFTPPPNNTI